MPGIDLAEERIEPASIFLRDYVASGKVSFVCQNIYDQDFLDRFQGKFDIIMLKDVIEHIPEQAKFIESLKNFLRPGGQIFFGFPPWYMPFGGHQQVAEKSITSKLPYYHIMPRSWYKAFLKVMGESQGTIQTLMEV